MRGHRSAGGESRALVRADDGGALSNGRAYTASPPTGLADGLRLESAPITQVIYAPGIRPHADSQLVPPFPAKRRGLGCNAVIRIARGGICQLASQSVTIPIQTSVLKEVVR